jgi:hypothetical protein
MIHSEILNALSSLNIPVAFQRYTGETVETYITFTQYDETSSLNANNREAGTNFYYQINIFSKKDYFDLVKEVKVLVAALGGVRINENDSSLDSGYYMRNLRFRFKKIN